MKNLSFLLILIFLVSCSNKQQARKPISQSSGTFIKESIERNKKLNEEEESLIEAYIKKDKVLMESGVRRENRKAVIDKIAAVFILQGYLDYKANGN